MYVWTFGLELLKNRSKVGQHAYETSESGEHMGFLKHININWISAPQDADNMDTSLTDIQISTADPELRRKRI